MKVLLAIDDSPWSEAAIDAMLTRIPAKGNCVIVLHVVTFLSHIHDGYVYGPIHEMQQIEKAQLAEGEKLVKRAAGRLSAAGLS
jgi:hypothetical protein